MNVNDASSRQPVILSEQSPLYPSAEQKNSDPEVLEGAALVQIHKWGIKAFQYNSSAKSKAGCCVLSTASGCGTVFALGSASYFGSCALALFSPIYCGFSAIFFSATVLPKVVSEYYWSKVASIFNRDGTVKHIVDREGNTLLYYAIITLVAMKDGEKNSEFNENLEKNCVAWCEYLIDHGALLTPPNIDKSPLWSAVMLNQVNLAKLFVKKKANIDPRLESHAFSIKRLLKKNNDDLTEWYKCLPRLKKLSTLQNRLKIFSNALDRNIVFKTFEGEGWTATIEAAKRFKKLYMAMMNGVFKGIHSSATQNLLLDSLNCLINKEDVFRKIGNLKAPILIDVGYTGVKENPGHCILLWIYEDIFVYADTGTQTCARLFNTTRPAVIGRIDRKKLTCDVMDEILSLKSSNGDDHYPKLMKICETLDLEAETVGFPAPDQVSGSCPWTAHVACMSAAASVSIYFLSGNIDEIFHPSEDRKDFDFKFSQARFFRDLMPLHFVNTSKLFLDPEFCSDRSFLPALAYTRDRFKKEDFANHIKWLAGYLSQDEEVAQKIVELREKAVVKLSNIIEAFDS